MMAQGYLVKTIIYRKLEERLASVPGTEEATGLTGIGGFIERTVQDMEPDAILSSNPEDKSGQSRKEYYP